MAKTETSARHREIDEAVAEHGSVAAAAAALGITALTVDRALSSSDQDDPDRPCFTCGRPPTGTFADGSPSYDHGHRPDGTVWEAGPDDGDDPGGFVPPSERSLPGIARYAIVALQPGDTAPDGRSVFVGRWRHATARPSQRAGRRGRAMGKVRGCPVCRHDHAVGTTCLECPGCRSGDLVRAAEEVFGELSPRDAGERGGPGHHGPCAPSEAGCEGDGGSPGREAGAVGSGPARRVLDGPRSTAIAGHTDSKGAAR